MCFTKECTCLCFHHGAFLGLVIMAAWWFIFHSMNVFILGDRDCFQLQIRCFRIHEKIDTPRQSEAPLLSYPGHRVERQVWHNSLLCLWLLQRTRWWCIRRHICVSYGYRMIWTVLCVTGSGRPWILYPISLPLCFKISLCSLFYNNTQGISSANDLIQKMDIGNQLYSSLSWLARQACLMQSELPTALNVFVVDHQLEDSESCSCTVHQEIAIGGYQFCRSLQRAFEALISESYTNFILTVGCVSVATYFSSNMGSKYFILMLEICIVLVGWLFLLLYPWNIIIVISRYKVMKKY